MFPEKPGVMAARELTADDVVFSYNRLDKSPKKIVGYFDHVDKVAGDRPATPWCSPSRSSTPSGTTASATATSRRSIPRRSSPPAPANWKNVNGTGPFMLTDFVPATPTPTSRIRTTGTRRRSRGTAYKLPFVDKITYRTIKDEATFITALRTAKLDILENIRWQNVEQLKKSAPALQWSKWLNMSGTFLSMRVDTKPFDDIRVRRALNMAVNKQEIVSAYYNGNAELFAYPQHPGLSRLLRAAGADAGLGEGAVHLRPRRRRSSCSPRPAIRRASASRSRSARAIPTTWSCCRWSPPIWSRSA